jgi:hypothetical protein
MTITGACVQRTQKPVPYLSINSFLHTAKSSYSGKLTNGHFAESDNRSASFISVLINSHHIDKDINIKSPGNIGNIYKFKPRFIYNLAQAQSSFYVKNVIAHGRN